MAISQPKRLMQWGVSLLIMSLIIVSLHLLFRRVQWPAVVKHSLDAPDLLIGLIIFYVVALIIFAIVPYGRTVLLIGFGLGQVTFFGGTELYAVLGYKVPWFGIIAINGAFLLCNYFWFSADQWAPDEINAEEFDLT